MYRIPLAVFLVSFQVSYSEIMCSAFMLSLFLRCFQPVLFCSISFESFSSGRMD